MRVRRLEIERFRGIRSLDWRFIGDTAGLVGPGDSGKSTILEAIERVLSPRWNHPFDDTDFHSLDTEQPIRIRATIVDFPAAFLKETKFGLALQALDADQGIAVAPSGEDDECLCIVVEVSVDSSLEPRWFVVDSTGAEHPIHVRDREALGMLRVGGNVDVHLGWSRGSVLTKVTESGDQVAAVLADATRKARAGLAVEDLDRLKAAASAVDRLGRDMGATIRHGLVPHIDVGAFSFNGGSLSLHDGDVPLRRSGLGSRRLVAVAMQHRAAGSAGITLVDEFEHGLEPHRVRQFLRKLRGLAPEGEDEKTGQLVLTTHAPVVISELEPEDIAVVRVQDDDSVTVSSIPEELRNAVLRFPHALLARRIIVAEGATEVGLLRGVERVWSENGANFAYLGVALVDGGGDYAPAVAGALVDLGYDVALFMDQDKAGTKLSRAKAAKRILWHPGRATENAVAEDLSDSAFVRLVELAHRGRGVGNPAQRSIAGVLAARVGRKVHEVGEDFDAWSVNVPDFRQVFGAAAKDKGWFKTSDLGFELGRIVADDLNNIDDTDLMKVLEAVRGFAEHG